MLAVIDAKCMYVVNKPFMLSVIMLGVTALLFRLVGCVLSKTLCDDFVPVRWQSGVVVIHRQPSHRQQISSTVSTH
jgi:hypothetical protein